MKVQRNKFVTIVITLCLICLKHEVFFLYFLFRKRRFLPKWLVLTNGPSTQTQTSIDFVYATKQYTQMSV